MTDKFAARRGALGKGINSLLGDFETHEQAPAKNSVPADQKPDAQILNLDVNAIEPNPHQPRKLFNDDRIDELAASLKRDGVLQPVLVARADKPGRYILIAGERRLRASLKAGLRKIPAIIRESSADDMLRLALIENIQRSDLNVVEEAEAYSSLIRDYGLTQEQCAERVGKDRATIANILRLLSLPTEIHDDLMENRLSSGHGKVLLSLEERSLIMRARATILKKHLSVRQTEVLVKAMKKNSVSDAATANTGVDKADLDYIANSLRSHLKTKVRIAGSATRGKIEISYFSSAELERLLGVMGHGR